MMPCKECIVYAVCKLKQEIVCDKATEYCVRPSVGGYTRYNEERIHEIIDYLGKGGACEAERDSICFADLFTDDGVKLN